MIGEVAPDSPFYPMPDHTPAVGDIAGDEAAQAYQLQFFKNNAVPRIAICVDGGKLDPTTREFILKYLAEGIRSEAHKTLLLETEAARGHDTSMVSAAALAQGGESFRFCHLKVGAR